jgi:hypothetical protein
MIATRTKARRAILVFFRFRIASSLPYEKKLVDLERERTSAEIGGMAALLSVHVR